MSETANQFGCLSIWLAGGPWPLCTGVRDGTNMTRIEEQNGPQQVNSWKPFPEPHSKEKTSQAVAGDLALGMTF